MWGAEGEELQKVRAQQKSQYAADLKKQMEEHTRNSQIRTNAAQQIIGKPKLRQLDYLSRNSQISPESEYSRNVQQTYQETENMSPRRYNQQMDYSQQQQQQQMQYQPQMQPYKQQQHDNGMSASYQQLQYKIDNIMNYEIPARIKPCEDSIASLNAKIDRQLTANTDMVMAMRDKFQELQMNINSLSQRVADNSDKLRITSQDFAAETQKLREQIMSTQSRVAQFDSVMRQIDDQLKGISQRQNIIEQTLNDSLGQMNEAISNVSRTSEMGDQHIMQQVEVLSKQTISTFGQANQNIQALSDSITTLSNDVRQSFAVVRSEFDTSIEEISKKAEQMTADSANVFQTMQDEVIQTFNSIHSLIDSTTKSFEEALSNEIATRQGEQQHILDANDIFTQAITTQLTSLAKAIDSTNTNMKDNIEGNVQDFLNQWKGDLGHFINDSAQNITDVQARMTQVETKLSEYIKSVGHRQDEIVELIKQAKVQPQFDDSELRNRIDKLEQEFRNNQVFVVQQDQTLSTPAPPSTTEDTTKAKVKPFLRPYVRMPESLRDGDTNRPPPLSLPKTPEENSIKSPAPHPPSQQKPKTDVQEKSLSKTDEKTKVKKRKKKENTQEDTKENNTATTPRLDQAQVINTVVTDEQIAESEKKEKKNVKETKEDNSEKQESGKSKPSTAHTEDEKKETAEESAKENPQIKRVKKKRKIVKDEASEKKEEKKNKDDDDLGDSVNTEYSEQKEESVKEQPKKAEEKELSDIPKPDFESIKRSKEVKPPETEKQHNKPKPPPIRTPKGNNTNNSLEKPNGEIDMDFFKPAESLAEVQFLDLRNLK